MNMEVLATLFVAAAGMFATWAAWVTVMIFEAKKKIELIKQEIEVLKDVRDLLSDIRHTYKASKTRSVS